MSVLASGVPLYCPHKSCGWSYDNAGKRGQDYLVTHLRVIHKDVAVDPADDPAPPVAVVRSSGRGRPPRWTSESAVAALQACAERLGRTPSSVDAKRATEHGLPALTVVARLFGSWPSFVEAAGFEPLPRRQWALPEREPTGPEAAAPTVAPPADVGAGSGSSAVVDSPEQPLGEEAKPGSRSENADILRALIAASRAFLDTLEKEIR